MSDACDKDASCQSCGQAGSCSPDEQQIHEQERIQAAMAQVKHKFMILSGKGGVGKSSVTTNLAATLAQEGFSVGVMDADIHGPNMPKMMGVDEQRLVGTAEGLKPIETESGVKVMSVAFLLQSKDDAIIWRGPLKHSLIKQFLGEVAWGPLDYLLIDLPPGTGDEALSTAHVIKSVDGAIIVTTPQDVALLDSRKSVNFCRQLNIPLIGIVENMSGFVCPHCEKELHIFKVGGGEKAAVEMDVPFLGRIPLNPGMVDSADKGTPFVTVAADSDVAQAFHHISQEWRALLNGATKEKVG
jgi:Mrp family chromosome partitioning ATPase